jgi:hypothetical protein
MTSVMTSAYCSPPSIDADAVDHFGPAASAVGASTPQFKRRSRIAPLAPLCSLDWRGTLIIPRTHIKPYVNSHDIQDAVINEILECNHSLLAPQCNLFPHVSLEIAAGDHRMHQSTGTARRAR